MVESVQPEAREGSSWDFLLIQGGAIKGRESWPGESVEEVSFGKRVALEEEVDLEEGF